MAVYVEYDDYDNYDNAYCDDPSSYGRSSSSYSPVPEAVKKFVIYFCNMIKEGNCYEMTNLYENGFPKLTEHYFKSIPWPEAVDIAPLVNDDHLFLILYKELYYRHILACVPGGTTLEHRFKSYRNYCDLFNSILSSETPIKLELPNQWLWEIIDEFIYQFQAFQQFRSKMVKKSAVDGDIDMLRSNTHVWDVLQVLNVLHAMIDKSNINQQLEVYSSGGNSDSVAGEFGRQSLYKMMGYFSLVGLLRLHSMLGDFYQAVKVLENVELNKKSLYARVPGCQITMYYYVGFAYIMMRRYADAIQTFSNILLYIQRSKGLFQSKSYQNDQINKQTDKMYILLAICLVLHPQRIDETLHSTLNDKTYAEKISKMQAGDLTEFENCFSYACPKFLSPVAPCLDVEGTNEVTQGDPLKLQRRVFLDEVKQLQMLPTIRSYLKLYSSMPMHKLAKYMAMNSNEVEDNLLCFKHKMRNVVLTKGGSGLEGEFQSESEVDFYINGGMIHVADTKVDRRYGDFFIRQIHKFDEIRRTLKTIYI